MNQRNRRSFTKEFKHEAASLVVDQSYSMSEACRAMGVGLTAMRRWVLQLQGERNGV
ncbi:MAG: transposase, partial [Desulfuromusa sp.]|nr:transposase [Desulfuromusa sp.]